MPWKVYCTKLANHVAPEHDIRPHDFVNPCWCWPIVDYPHSNNVLHDSFLPMDEDLCDDENPNPPLHEA